MKHFLSLTCLFFVFTNLNAQRAVVLEDNVLTICDVDLTGGLTADTIYLCQQSYEGTTIVNGLCAEYTPNLNYFGYDSVCLTTCILGVCTDTVVNITVQPVGESIYQNTPEDANFFVCEAIISGGSNVVIAGCSAPLYGTANYNPSCVIYSPPLNYVGPDSFCIVSCLDTLCDTSTLVMNMTPVTETINVTVPGNGEITICLPQLLTVVDSVTGFSLSCGPINSNGVPVVNSGQQCVTYTPDASFDGTGLTGTDQICISVCNSLGVCDVTNININITGFQVLNNFNATDLAESLAGAGVTITGAFLTCPNNASGKFVNSPNALGLEDGIILTCGNAIDVQGASPATFISTSNGAPGDADLTALISSTNPMLVSTDACVLEFDVEVLGDSLTFNYVFGSEEYDEYVCSNFNDVFGFFVSGANPGGGVYANQNVALIPGTTTAVSINSVNNGSVGTSGTPGSPGCNTANSAFFNGTVTDIVYDGNTVALESKIYTVPCTNYHFKLGVADGTPNTFLDQSFDSGVFVEAGSFTSLPVTLASSTILGAGFVNAVEGCVDGEFRFELDAALPVDYGIKFQIAGTAINGVDYTIIQDSITFFAGDTAIIVNIIPTNDGVSEGNEIVKLYLLNPCTSLPFDSAELTIIDLIPFNLTTVPDTICSGDTTVLHATIAGDDNNLAIYSWTPNNGSVLDIDSGYTQVTPTITTDYIVEYTLGACTQFDTTKVVVSEFSIAIDTNLISCPGAADGGFAIIPSNAIGNVTYLWQPSMSIDSFVNNLGPDTLFLTIMDESGLVCGTLLDTLILEEPFGLSFTTSITNVSCNGLDDGSALVSNLSPFSNYQVDVVYNGVPVPSQFIAADAAGEIFVGNLATGVYDSIVISNPLSGCSNSFGFTITEPALLTADITAPGVVLCVGGTIDSLSALVTGGNLPYSFLWNTSAVTQTITGMSPGLYWVEVTDSNNCMIRDSFVVAQANPLYLNILGDDVSCLGGNDGITYVDSISGGAGPYTFFWDGATGSQVGDTAFNLSAGLYSLMALDFNGCNVFDSIQIVEWPVIVINEIHVDVACFGDTSGLIDLTVSGGQTPYGYSWTGPNGFASLNEDISNLEAGSYQVFVTDNNACVDSLAVSIIEPNALGLAIDSTNVTCKGLADGTAAVTASGASGGYTYLWNDALAQNTATAVGLDVGNYQVIVSDANGCQDSLAVLIEEPDSLLLSLDDLTNVLCNGGNTGSISVSTTGGTIAYSYLWSNGGGANEDLSNATAGMYTLTVTDANACTAQLSATITEPTALTINLAGTNIFCFGGIDGEVDATVNGGVSPYTYGWTGPNGFTSAVEDINALSAGTYTLTVTDSNNCVMNESITITQPADVVITFSEVSVNCFGGNDGSLTAQVLTGGTAPFQFQWDAAANNQNTAMATGLIAGTYMVTVTDGNGCTFTNSSTVTEPLAPLQIAVTGTDINCAGYNDGIASVVATGGTAGYTYLWNDPQAQTNAQATNLSSNTYQVTVTDANGCTETGSVFIDEPTPIAVVATPDSANCWGDATGSITVEALGGTGVGYAYSLDGGETFQNSPNFLNLPAGVYDEIIVQDLGSNSVCLSQLYTTTVYEQPYFSFEVIPGDTTLQLEESITLELSVTSPNYTNSAIAEVNWYPTTGLNCADCIDPTVLTYEHYTEYTATVYYYGGDDELCSATANTIIQVENSLLLFIPNAFTPGSYDDVNRTFEVFGEGIEFVKMQVYNRWGEKVFESSNQRVSWDGTYKGEMQGPGVYSYYVNVEYLDGKTIDRKGSVSILR